MEVFVLLFKFFKVDFLFFILFRYAPTRRKVAELIEARKERISNLVDSFNEYEKLIAKASKAVDFYEKLEKNVSDLQKNVQKAVEENERIKDAEIAKLAPKPSKSILKIESLEVAMINSSFHYEY